MGAPSRSGDADERRRMLEEYRRNKGAHGAARSLPSAQSPSRTSSRLQARQAIQEQEIRTLQASVQQQTKSVSSQPLKYARNVSVVQRLSAAANSAPRALPRYACPTIASSSKTARERLNTKDGHEILPKSTVLDQSNTSLLDQCTLPIPASEAPFTADSTGECFTVSKIVSCEPCNYDPANDLPISDMKNHPTPFEMSEVDCISVKKESVNDNPNVHTEVIVSTSSECALPKCLEEATTDAISFLKSWKLPLSRNAIQSAISWDLPVYLECDSKYLRIRPPALNIFTLSQVESAWNSGSRDLARLMMAVLAAPGQPQRMSTVYANKFLRIHRLIHSANSFPLTHSSTSSVASSGAQFFKSRSLSSPKTPELLSDVHEKDSFIKNEEQTRKMQIEIDEVISRTPEIQRITPPRRIKAVHDISVLIRTSERLQRAMRQVETCEKHTDLAPAEPLGSACMYIATTPTKRVCDLIGSAAPVSPVRRSLRIAHSPNMARGDTFACIEDIPDLAERGFIPNPAVCEPFAPQPLKKVDGQSTLTKRPCTNSETDDCSAPAAEPSKKSKLNQ